MYQKKIALDLFLFMIQYSEQRGINGGCVCVTVRNPYGMGMRVDTTGRPVTDA